MHYKEVKAVLSPQNGMNIYRGCTHGCIYCDSRSKCHRINHDFEDIEVKVNPDYLLEHTLRRKRNKGMITAGALTDPYVPEEAELQVFRRCINQIERFDFGLVVQTKSNLIMRDIDILEKINRKTKCVVCMTLTTYDNDLCGKLEPNVCTTEERVKVLKAMHERGIPTIVYLTPILPYINDTEDNLLGILNCCAEVGVYGIINNGMGVMLRDGCREYFFNRLEELYPGMTAKYLMLMDGGNEAVSPNSKALMEIFTDFCREHGIIYDKEELIRYMREYKNKTLGTQMSIFDY
jgi:DNA repair photolyase